MHPHPVSNPPNQNLLLPLALAGISKESRDARDEGRKVKGSAKLNDP